MKCRAEQRHRDVFAGRVAAGRQGSCRRQCSDGRYGAVCVRSARTASTIEHHGGYWCSNCGRFAKAPDPKLLPSNQKGYREPERNRYEDNAIYSECGWCHQRTDMTDGIYDDGMERVYRILCKWPLHRKWRPSFATFRCIWRNQVHQLLPWNDLLHLLQEFAFTCFFWWKGSGQDQIAA